MHIFVNTGTDGTTITLNVVPEDAIQNVKRKIMDQIHIEVPSKQQHIFFNDQELENDRTLKDYGIEHRSTLFVDPYSEAGSRKKCIVS